MASRAERVGRDSFAAWNSHDVDRIASFYTEDCVHEDVAVGAVIHGVQELKKTLSGLFIWSPDVRLDLAACFGAGNDAASEWTMSGTHRGTAPEVSVPATGKHFSVKGASVYRLRDGMISRDCDYWNLASFLQQVGLLSVPTRNP